MNHPARFAAIAVLAASCLALGACGKKEKAHQAAPAKPSSSTEVAPARTSFEEPSEDVLRKLMFQQIERFDAAGGVPMTVTSTGQSGRVRQKLHEARKLDCKLMTVAGMFDCTMNLKVKMWFDGQPEPEAALDDNKGLRAFRDDGGTWHDCTYENTENKALCQKAWAGGLVQ